MSANAVIAGAPAEELAEVEMFADVLGDALLTRYRGVVRPVHRIVVARMMRDGGAVALLAALDAVREVAGRGESRAVALEAFVWALTRGEAPPLPAGASAEELTERTGDVEEHVRRVGADAYLLERMAEEREAFAEDAAGFELAEEALARADVSDLRGLAHRHALHFAGRDVAPRPPFVEENATAQLARNANDT